MTFRSMKRVLGSAALALIATGCYHVQVETGLPPNGEMYTKNWAHSFISGLIPPATAETASKCQYGVAKVESQISIANWLVIVVTQGIYSPMQIRVSCAGRTAGSSDASTIEAASDAPKDVHEALLRAAELSVKSGEPILVKF